MPALSLDSGVRLPMCGAGGGASDGAGGGTSGRPGEVEGPGEGLNWELAEGTGGGGGRWKPVGGWLYTGEGRRDNPIWEGSRLGCWPETSGKG